MFAGGTVSVLASGQTVIEFPTAGKAALNTAVIHPEAFRILNLDEPQLERLKSYMPGGGGAVENPTAPQIRERPR